MSGVASSLRIAAIAATLLWCALTAAAEQDDRKQASDDRRCKLVMLISEPEYQTARTLPEFARHHLAGDFRSTIILGSERDGNVLPGIEALADADVALISIRRRALPKSQLDVIRKFVAAGKPLVGIRTASHAFDLGNNAPSPPGHDQWPEFDRIVWGGNYHGHYGNRQQTGQDTIVWAADGVADNPLVHGVLRGEFKIESTLYKNEPLRDGTRVLMLGRVGTSKLVEPVAWTHTSPAGGRVFYTSLGGPADFQNKQFTTLLTNAVYWAAGRQLAPAQGMVEGNDGRAAKPGAAATP